MVVGCFFKYFAPPHNEEIHLVVFDSLGNGLVKVVKKREEAFGSFIISPNGKIIGGYISKEMGGKWIRHLFFLDVETGRTKVVRAEGKINGRKWSFAPDVRKDKKLV